ncbi:MAG: hypothetical protein N2323_02205 [candidate division WOR-3 bacterium]|nr:hypothetical protein [candidate division WOR-3 bacterium]MCX7836760.1 hypothetical protein [candidate division WOR-3 bacterium]MDW8113602.1 hypothetical protein [candidate division WOR-3 bacterium]
MILAIKPRDLETIAILEEITFGPDREDSSIHISIPIILGCCQDKEAVISVAADLINFSKRYQHAAAWFISEQLIKELEAAEDMITSDNPAYGGILLSREIDNYHMQVRLIKQFGMYTVDVKWHNDRIGDEYSLQLYYAYLKLRPKMKNFEWENLNFNKNLLSIKINFPNLEEEIEKLRRELFLTSLAIDLNYEVPYYLFNKMKVIGLEKELIRQAHCYYNERKKEMLIEITLWDYQIKNLILETTSEKLIIRENEIFSSEINDFLNSFINFLREEILLVEERRKKYLSERPIYGQR